MPLVMILLGKSSAKIGAEGGECGAEIETTKRGIKNGIIWHGVKSIYLIMELRREGVT